MSSKFTTFIFCSFCSIVCFFSSTELKGQKQTFKINNIRLNDTTQRLLVKTLILDAQRKRPELISRNFNVSEEVGGERERLQIEKIVPFDGKRISQDTFNVLFLVDVSGSMRTDDRIGKAKLAVKESIQEITFSPQSKVYLSTFANEVSPSKQVDKTVIVQEAEIIQIPPKGADTDLFRALFVKINELKTKKGTNVLILLSDGVNDIANNPYYKTNSPIPSETVLQLASTLSEDFLLFPIGLGGKVDSLFLKALPEKTKNQTDYYIPTYNPDELKEIFKSIFTEFTTNAVFYIYPDAGKYRGEKRDLKIEWKKGGISDNKIYQKGTTDAPVLIGQKKMKWWDWLIQALVGSMLVASLYIGLKYWVPLYKKRLFRKLYVQKYVQEANVIRRDPLTQDAFQEGDMVVVKCQQMVALSTWDAIGHCPNYPACMEFAKPCDGAGGSDNIGDFFSQKGIFKTFNWIFFGALGGLIGWFLYAITKLTNFTAPHTLLKYILKNTGLEQKLLQSQAGEHLISNTLPASNEAIVGVVLATGIAGTLSYVEDKGDARKFSVSRVLIRTLLSFLAACIIFLKGSALQYLVFGGNPFISGLVTWTFFGLVFGMILSFNSSILLKRGIMASVIACSVGFIVYHFIIIISNDSWSKLFSFIVLGALLGWIIVSVISSLEDFEIRYISPQLYWGIIKPISKWLRRGLEVWIGTEPKCYVFIKWEDEKANSMHAKLTLENDVVYIEAKAETLLNGVILPLNVKTPLHNNDIIQLGVGSVSKMQYIEKRRVR